MLIKTITLIFTFLLNILSNKIIAQETNMQFINIDETTDTLKNKEFKLRLNEFISLLKEVKLPHYIIDSCSNCNLKFNYFSSHEYESYRSKLLDSLPINLFNRLAFHKDSNLLKKYCISDSICIKYNYHGKLSTWELIQRKKKFLYLDSIKDFSFLLSSIKFQKCKHIKENNLYYNILGYSKFNGDSLLFYKYLKFKNDGKVYYYYGLSKNINIGITKNSPKAIYKYNYNKSKKELCIEMVSVNKQSMILSHILYYYKVRKKRIMLFKIIKDSIDITKRYKIQDLNYHYWGNIP